MTIATSPCGYARRGAKAERATVVSVIECGAVAGAVAVGAGTAGARVVVVVVVVGADVSGATASGAAPRGDAGCVVAAHPATSSAGAHREPSEPRPCRIALFGR